MFNFANLSIPVLSLMNVQRLEARGDLTLPIADTIQLAIGYSRFSSQVV